MAQVLSTAGAAAVVATTRAAGINEQQSVAMLPLRSAADLAVAVRGASCSLLDSEDVVHPWIVRPMSGHQRERYTYVNGATACMRRMWPACGA